MIKFSKFLGILLIGSALNSSVFANDSVDSLKANINKLASDLQKTESNKSLSASEKKFIIEGHKDLAEMYLINCEAFRGVRIGRLQIKGSFEPTYCESELKKAILEVRKKPLVAGPQTETVIKWFQDAQPKLVAKVKAEKAAKKAYGFVSDETLKATSGAHKAK